MNAYLNMDNLMDFFKLNRNPFFAQFYNEILSVNENQDLDIRGTEWGEMQPVFTYEMYEQYNDGVEVMATFTDLDSDPYPTGGEIRTKKLTGSIPRHKALVVLNEADYRAKLQQLYGIQSTAALMGNDPATAVRNNLEKYFYTKLSAIPNAHKNTLNFMVQQLKSRLDFTLNERTNPQGIKGLTFPSHVPDANRREYLFWTVNADGTITYDTTKDPVDYFKNITDGIRENEVYRYRYENITAEMSRKTFKVLMGHPAWASHYGLILQPQFYLTEKEVPDNGNIARYGAAKLADMALEAKVAVFKQLCGFDELLLSKSVVGTEHIVKLTDAAPKLERETMDAFDYGKVLIRPSGNAITLIPVAPMRPDNKAVTAGLYGGRGIIEYFYNEREKVQTWRSELTAFPVFNNPSNVYSITIAKSLSVNTNTLSFTASSTAAKTVTATGAAPYTATASESWLNVTVNGGTVSVKPVAANTGSEARNATVTISDSKGAVCVVEVTQAGA